jgi:hypothetical protein
MRKVLRWWIGLEGEGAGIEWGFKMDPEEYGLSLHQPQNVCMVGVRAAEYDYGCAGRSRTAEGRPSFVPRNRLVSARTRRAVTGKRETGGRRG